ncbi:MAG: DEAD/DEAH box helicase [Candidatus Krumholzibacteriia bacterium]
MASATYTLSLSPAGHLRLAPGHDGVPLADDLAVRLLRAFERGNGHALLHLGGVEVAGALPPALGYWRRLGVHYLTAVCTRSGGDAPSLGPGPLTPDPGFLAELALAPPVMPGAEYATPEVLAALWDELDAVFRAGLAASGTSLQEFLKSLDESWNLVGRIHFHLAVNRKDPEFPFAFLATYTPRLATGACPQHQPLGQALREYAGPGKRDRLLNLLLPVQRAAGCCPWLKELVASGELYHPLRWTADEAFALLKDVALLERAGVLVRMPADWARGRPLTPRLAATVGGGPPSILGTDALLDFQIRFTLGGETLTPAEIADLLERSEGLAMIRGRWVEIDGTKVSGMLERFRQLESLQDRGGLSFGEAMRMLAGADLTGSGPTGGARVPAGGAGTAAAAEVADWMSVTAGPWLEKTLAGLRFPEGLAAVRPGVDLHATLRPYQEVGVRWLHLLSELGLGACLADDMGLGKTIQVLSLLLVRRARARRAPGARSSCDRPTPSLLVAPASLLANWADEIARFTPGLKPVIAHSSSLPGNELKDPAAPWIEGADLVITSYATLLRLPALAERSWDLVILDEAQAIKNPGARQTRAVKQLHGRARIVLTGTPIENRLGDLWSIFDFINPGLLGRQKQFSQYVGDLDRESPNPYAPLRDLVRPYILRRLKTDRSVIADLPDKTEMRAFCHLSRRQAALYEQSVRDLRHQLAVKTGMERRGLVLAFLMRFKQICNHPSQWLGDGAWEEKDSGKWTRLREIAEVIAARQEKVLVFTQFREITAPLADHLGGLFGRPGLVLHGQTPVGRRRDLVRRFQEDEDVPFFVLSLKAGGSGLNLTAASHVVHFDRWWNPAVEEQATDRAFRIGQARNVLVHKFICRGTVEDRIDTLIESKKQIARDLLEGGPELLLTEMSDDELIDLVSLDLQTALKEQT